MFVERVVERELKEVLNPEHVHNRRVGVVCVVVVLRCVVFVDGKHQDWRHQTKHEVEGVPLQSGLEVADGVGKVFGDVRIAWLVILALNHLE